MHSWYIQHLFSNGYLPSDVWLAISRKLQILVKKPLDIGQEPEVPSGDISQRNMKVGFKLFHIWITAKILQIFSDLICINLNFPAQSDHYEDPSKNWTEYCIHSLLDSLSNRCSTAKRAILLIKCVLIDLCKKIKFSHSIA